MFLQNEKLEIIDSKELIKELLNEETSLESEIISEDEVNELLNKWYIHSDNVMSIFLFDNKNRLYPNRSVLGVGDILKKIKNYICKVLEETSTNQDLIEAVLEAISGIIPGGVVIKPILKKIIKYFLERGYQTICRI